MMDLHTLDITRLKTLAKSLKRKLGNELVPSLLFQGCFDEQRAFIADANRRKAALCSRRAGKTYTLACYLLREAIMHPGTLNAYVALTRTSAKRIIWPELQLLCRNYEIDAKFNHTELTVELANKSTIWLSGAQDESEIEKFRGSKYRLVCLDEAQSFKSHIENLIFEVFEPALLDHDGTMVMAGTPSAACSGTFYDATEGIGKVWSTHKWTVRDNPHIAKAEQWIERMMQENGWTDDNPIYRREWLGEWARSDEQLVYRFNEARNVAEAPLGNDWHHIVGVDFGYEDATAFVVVAFSYKSPDVHIVHCFSRSGLIPSEIARILAKMRDDYEPLKIVVDTGGLGKALAEEFKQRYHIPVEPARKKDKFEFIELFNSDMMAGRIKAYPEAPVIDEWQRLQLDSNSKKLQEDPRFDNHLADATLYAWRESRHYTYQRPQDPPKVGSQEYMDMIEEELLEEAIEEEQQHGYY